MNEENMSDFVQFNNLIKLEIQLKEQVKELFNETDKNTQS